MNGKVHFSPIVVWLWVQETCESLGVTAVCCVEVIYDICFGLCEFVRYWRVLVSTCGKDFIGYGKSWELRNRPGRCSSIWELMLLGKVSRWETRRLECWKTKTKNRTKARTSRYLFCSIALALRLNLEVIFKFTLQYNILLILPKGFFRTLERSSTLHYNSKQWY